MGAICKTIEIHGDNLQPLLDYGENKEKTSLFENDVADVESANFDTDLKNLFDYAANEKKTLITLKDGEQSMLVTGVLCNPNTAQLEFGKIRNKYRESNPEILPNFDFLDKKTGELKGVQKKPVTAIHLIQSFEEKDLDPRIVNQIGVELVERLGVQAVVDTHMNTDHLHNHIIINAYMPDGISKFGMNKAKRMEIRRLSDDIQREFGLEISFNAPEIQLKLSNRSLNYSEWQAQRNGTSWKDMIRKDMLIAKDLAEDKNDYINIMKSFGYDIASEKIDEETDYHSIMWLNKDGKKKIWDRKLGDNYITSNITNPDYKHIHIEQENERKQYKTTKFISVARYDINGHRRSDLEMLVRKAIALIQRIALYMKKKNKTLSKYNAPAKIELLQEALIRLKEYDIQDMADLNSKIDLASKNLHLAKKASNCAEIESSFFDVLEKVVRHYEYAKKLYDSVEHWTFNHEPYMYINEYSASQTQASASAISPLSSKEKAELSFLMKKIPDYNLIDIDNDFANVTSIQFREIKDYVYKKGPKPKCLVNKIYAEYIHAYEKQYNYLKDNNYINPSKKQLAEVKSLLEEHGFKDIDVSKITYADVVNIKNCYSQNPFDKKLAPKDKVDELMIMLDRKDLHLKRKIISFEEYQDVLDFLNGKRRNQPDILKERIEPYPDALNKLLEIVKRNNFTSSIPLAEMDANDIKKYYQWAVSQGRTPFCTLKTNEYTWNLNKEKFHESIKNESEKKQEILIDLRNAMNELAQMGYSVDEIDILKENISAFKNRKNEVSEIKKELSKDYKELLKLKQQISHAKSKEFIYGNLIVDVSQKTEDINDIEKELEKEMKEKEQENDIYSDDVMFKKKSKALDLDFDI